MYKLKVTDTFSAAHQLSITNKKCENLHGHNWKVEVSITGNILDKSGILVDFSIIKKFLRKIIQDLDHKFLNELNYFRNGNPSSENIAFYIAEQMQTNISNYKIKINKVTVWESVSTSATYYPEHYDI